jgi:hypothetical protein
MRRSLIKNHDYFESEFNEVYPGFLTKFEEIGVKNCQNVYCTTITAVLSMTPNKNDCIPEQFVFEQVKSCPVVVNFKGEPVTSDAGLTLIAELDKKREITSRLAACFKDYREPNKVLHPVNAIIAQRIYGLIMGYEDINDHENLRHDARYLVVPCNGAVERFDRNLVSKLRIKTTNNFYRAIAIFPANRLYKMYTDKSLEFIHLYLEPEFVSHVAHEWCN